MLCGPWGPGSSLDAVGVSWESVTFGSWTVDVSPNSFMTSKNVSVHACVHVHVCIPLVKAEVTQLYTT